MMKKILPLTLMLAVMFSTSSCLHSDDDDTSYTTYNDAALTAFAVTNANQYIHTLSPTGEDSVYMKTLTTSSYKFYIDQEQRTVYNPDSLPYGTDAAHLLVTATAKNGGYILLKSMTSDSLTYLQTTDSVNFTQPRTLRIYSNDGSDYRDYQVTVNVHQQYGDTLLWSNTSVVEAAKQCQHMRMVSLAGQLYLFTSDGTITRMWHGGTGGTAWEESNILLGADVWKNVITRGDELFLLNGTELTKMNAGNSWSLLNKNANIQQLIAASSTELYALSRQGGILVSADNGATWTQESLDSDAALLPTDNISYNCRTTKTNSEVERIVITGTCPGSSYAVAWSKLADPQLADSQWMFVDQAGDYQYALPKYQPLTTFDYDGKDVALGIDAETGAFSDLLVSRDGGITWKTDSAYYLPEGISTANGDFTATVDSQNRIWILCGGNGQLWQGRITRLGWEKQ